MVLCRGGAEDVSHFARQLVVELEHVFVLAGATSRGGSGV